MNSLIHFLLQCTISHIASHVFPVFLPASLGGELSLNYFLKAYHPLSTYFTWVQHHNKASHALLSRESKNMMLITSEIKPLGRGSTPLPSPLA